MKTEELKSLTMAELELMGVAINGQIQSLEKDIRDKSFQVRRIQGQIGDLELTQDITKAVYEDLRQEFCSRAQAKAEAEKTAQFLREKRKHRRNPDQPVPGTSLPVELKKKRGKCGPGCTCSS